MASINFNAAAVQPSSHEPVAPGTYEAVIVNSESQAMKSGNEPLDISYTKKVFPTDILLSWDQQCMTFG